MFTGWKDVGLSEEGEAEAHRAGQLLKEEGLVFDSAFASTLKRAHNTLDIILGELGQGKLPTVKAAALNERDYGQLVGINKEEARKRFGADQVHVWQRSYDIAPPGGESLKDTAARVCPFFDRWIVPELQAGKNVIVVAHGNSLRSLIMELDKLTPEEVQDYSIATATPVIYRVKADGTLVEKRNLAA
jgi:2,3-bisphosphoglycerate-dependent phosphoglycerate mutase